MPASVRHWDIPVTRRIDGEPWNIRVIEVSGSQPGPATVFVAGIYGEEAMSCLMMHELVRRLTKTEFRGKVTVIPVANPPGLAAATRSSPDGSLMNRLFPGDAKGILTSQLCYHVFKAVKEQGDCVVDFHSGSPWFHARFVWDYGDTPLAASFGVPVVMGMRRDGQLAMAATKAGMTSFLVETGGGPGGPKDFEDAMERSFNTLRHRGHIDAPLTGPKTVPTMNEQTIFMSSMHGNFYGDYRSEHVGQMLQPGVLGRMINVASGETMETFELKKPGELLLANVSPYIMTPCFCAYVIGHASGEAQRRTA